MSTVHDDTPHPIPPTAYLRYKENWLFILMDIDQGVFGIAHFNHEPGFDRARFSCNLMVRGRLFKYGNQTPFPAKFAFSPQIGDDKLKVTFVEPYEQMHLRLDSDDILLDVSFRRHAPAFDFEAYEAANPDLPKTQEVIGLATNQEFHHQTQAMTVAGTLRVKADGASSDLIALEGLGYRDHSRGTRADNLLLRHVWSYLHFPGVLFGAMSVTGSFRPGLTASSGYVYDAAGLRALGTIEMSPHGKGEGGMPDSVTFHLPDIFGKPHTVIAHIGQRVAHVPLVTEAPGAGGHAYTVVENFCPIVLEETGEKGFALVEIGYSSNNIRGV
jgi:hypothetical protein